MPSNLRHSSHVFSRRASLLAMSGIASALTGTLAGAATDSTTTINWDKIAQEFLMDRSLLYLNTGTLGATPKSVVEARCALGQRLESNPAGEGFGSILQEAEAVIPKIADLIGCSAKEATVTRNTTEGMNFIAEGINLQAGQRVLVSNHEHPGGLRAFQFLKKTRGVEIDVAEIHSPPQSEDEVVDSFRKVIQPKTRVIMCSYVHFSNGLRTPIARLSELAHQHGCLMVVDGAQASGGVAVNVKELGCDAYASSGHKFLLGPKGTGILYINEQARDQITPMQLDDGLGFYTAIRGTSSMPEVIGLGAVLDWTRQIGRSAVFDRLMSLRNMLYSVLEKTPHVTPRSPPPGSSMASQLVCFSVDDRDRHEKLKEQFTQNKVLVRGVNIDGVDFRLSVHLYNTEADIARFEEILLKGVT
ncbi:MAG: aminotransferase class V-fold PLP-dependent enzyme [Planctomycetaceae bacterium]